MKKHNYLLLLLAIFTFTSCEKFLTENPNSFLTPTNFYKNEKDAVAALNGVFSTMQPQGYYQRTVYVVSENGADLMYAGAGSADRNTITQHTFTAVNGEISNWYNNNYKMIRNANDVIFYVPAITMDEAKKNNIIGNARFLRALAYFNLLTAYGEVPLITEPVSASDPNLYPPKATLASLYNQIIEDLKFAELNCFAEKDIAAAEKGRVSAGASSALLAKVYLTRAKSTEAQPTDSQDALTACNKVIGDTGSYALLNNYADIFSSDNKYNKEVVFAVRFGTAPNVANITLRMFYPTVLGGYGSFLVQNEFFNNGFPEGSRDVRKTYSVANTANGQAVTPFIYKFRDSQWKKDNNSRTDWYVLRLAEVYLLQSEAMNNINPNDPNKFNGINTIRKRAGLTLATDEFNLINTPTPEAFVDMLLAERARELCGEGQRRWDLLRFGKLKEAMAKVGVTVDDEHLLFPIPQAEQDVNPNF
ncbi:MAG TPA: RagB/SusD family nutrient uptake outer membrane protein [Pelobium sp.]|nr:RagB/SusD family nutrient uptake outer membrane protein [Pelobium sp.]